MVTPDRRQLWINGTTKWCPHDRLEEIRSEDGKVLADVCRACGLRIAEYGKCHGCGRDRRLIKFVVSKRKRYCTEDCAAAAAAIARAEKDARATAKTAAAGKDFPK